MIGILKALFGSIDPKLTEAMKNGAFLVDVRTREEFRMGNAAGSINIPLDQIQNNLDKFRNKKEIVVYCQSGARSARAKIILEDNQIQNVINGGGLHRVLKIQRENGR